MSAHVTRRDLLRTGIASLAASALPLPRLFADVAAASQPPLAEFRYDQVAILGARQLAQRENVTSVLMGLNEDSLLKPFREMSASPGSVAAPGASLGGWYEWKSDYDFHHDTVGLAPGATFGQWTSALARLHAASKFTGTGDAAIGDRAIRLNRLLGEAIGPGYFAQTRFPAYSYDKLVCGLMDAHRLLADPAALPVLDRVTAAATPALPGRAIDRDLQWKPGADISWMWDETYTLPENLYLVAANGGSPRYRRMADAYLDDATYFEPLARGVNVLSDKHAYSYVNALCSAMQCYLTTGSSMHLDAGRNGFALLQQQSFATGGWGPDELLRKPGYDDLAKSLVASHNGFETPCGSYAHMKLTRYLLRATRDGRYGDSMERVLHNTVLGVLPLQPDGRSFYYLDYNNIARRAYSTNRWPCCSGTLPQVVADYGINTYLRDRNAVYVNLYQPSQLRWSEGATQLTLDQSCSYPDDGAVRLRITASQPVAFALRLRIPGWAQDQAAMRVNGRTVAVETSKGFATIDRLWRSGDLVELDLPISLRLEELPANGGPAHPEIGALLRGPVVLFAIREPADSGPIRVSRDALLRARQTGPREWTASTALGDRRLVPFVDVGDREYSTYVTLS
jgi:hypothetical protein